MNDDTVDDLVYLCIAIVTLVMGCVVLTGCANTPGNITPEAVEKNAVVCGNVTGIWGAGNTLYVNANEVKKINGDIDATANKEGCSVKVKSTGIIPP